MMFADGVAEFTLTRGKELTATGLPADFNYKVTEAEAKEDGYTPAVAGNNATGAIQADGTVTVAFLNTRKAPATRPARTSLPPPASRQPPRRTPARTLRNPRRPHRR